MKGEPTMNATNVLMDEHRVIERVLNSLEMGADRLESGQPVRQNFSCQPTDFIRVLLTAATIKRGRRPVYAHEGSRDGI